MPEAVKAEHSALSEASRCDHLIFRVRVQIKVRVSTSIFELASVTLHQVSFVISMINSVSRVLLQTPSMPSPDGTPSRLLKYCTSAPSLPTREDLVC